MTRARPEGRAGAVLLGDVRGAEDLLPVVRTGGEVPGPLGHDCPALRVHAVEQRGDAIYVCVDDAGTAQPAA